MNLLDLKSMYAGSKTMQDKINNAVNQNNLNESDVEAYVYGLEDDKSLFIIEPVKDKKGNVLYYKAYVDKGDNFDNNSLIKNEVLRTRISYDCPSIMESKDKKVLEEFLKGCQGMVGNGESFDETEIAKEYIKNVKDAKEPGTFFTLDAQLFIGPGQGV